MLADNGIRCPVSGFCASFTFAGSKCMKGDEWTHSADLTWSVQKSSCLSWSNCRKISQFNTIENSSGSLGYCVFVNLLV